MKTLKTFVCQKARPESSMEKGWLVQESCVWISEYLRCVDTMMLRLRTMEDDDTLFSKVDEGKDFQFGHSEEEKDKV